MNFHTLVKWYTGKSLAVYKLAKGWHEQADIACSYLEKAAKKMKKWVDKKRHQTEFQVGDLVLLKLIPQQFKSFKKGAQRTCEEIQRLFAYIGTRGQGVL